MNVKGATIIVILAVLAGGLIYFGLSGTDSQSPNENISEEFMNQIITIGIERAGQPIEGFDAFILRKAFPGFIEDDFEGVKTLEGHYVIDDGDLEFRRDTGGSVTSAEQTLSSEGYGTLLSNVSKRLKMTVSDGDTISELITYLSDEYDNGNDIKPPARTTTYDCRPDERHVDACIEIYAPVCASVNVQCITTPCEPALETFSNGCFACQNELVTSYMDGKCTTIIEL